VLPVFLVTFPFFALIAAGYGAARARILPLDAIPGLNSFVLYFALPCMLLRFGAGTPIGQLLDGSVALVWGLSALAVVGGVVAFTRNARIGWNDAAFGALVAAFPNTGFMGVPLLVAILGAQAAGPMIITIAFDLVVTSSLCIALSRLDGASGSGAHHGPRQAARQALRGILVNPMPWSILLGVLLSAARWKLPGPVERTVRCWPAPPRRWLCSPSARCSRARRWWRASMARARPWPRPWAAARGPCRRRRWPT